MIASKSISKRLLPELVNIIKESLRNNTASMNLDYIWIDEEGIEFISNSLNNIPLKTLSLRYCKLGNEGVTEIAKILEKNTSVENLNIEGNFITDVGIKKLALALKTNKSLKYLDLKYNGINRKGAQSIAEALKINKTLESLDLGNNFIGDEGAEAIVDVMRVTPISGNKSLKTINLEHNYIITLNNYFNLENKILDVLETNKYVTTFNIKFHSFENNQRLENILRRNRRIELTILLYLIRKYKGRVGLWRGGIPKGIMDMIITRAI
jgi:hypothetical protein